MKVQCGQCPAKYAVSDERVQDKKVRIHCKRCGASIVVDGKVDPPLVTSTPARKSQRPTGAPPDSQPPPPPEREPESRPSPRPVAHTIMGGLEAPAADRLRSRSSPPPKPVRSPATPHARADEPPPAGMPAQHRGLTDPPLGADESRWRVALTKQDLRWMTTNEIIEAYHAGAVKLETFVFRTGMPTWVTLLEVPEISDALARAGAAEASAGHSSLPPPRSPSSQPPPRKLPRPSAAEAHSLAELAELDASEPMPFALVAERSNGASPPPAVAAREPSPPAPPPRPPAEQPPPRPAAEAPPAERPPAPARPVAPLPAPLQPGPPPFAAAQQASGSSRWVWVAVVLLLLGAVAALIGPRYGLKLL